MAQLDLQGLGVALITPFRPDGTIDFDALSRLIDRQLQGGADFLVVLGTTAETPTLSLDEQHAIVRQVVKQAGGRLPIVLGLGGNNTAAVAERLKTDDLTGIDAILSVVPYYNKPTQEGIYQHYKCLSAASPLPLILYNVPARTGANMTAETTLRLANDCPNIIAVKEASSNIPQIEQIIKNKPAGFQVTSGDDNLACQLILSGAVGVISVLGNAFPQQMKELVTLAEQGKTEQAQALHHQLSELFALLFTDGNPAGIKSMLHQSGLIDNHLRLPLVPVSAATAERIRLALSQLQHH